jgi:hypothetical protein
VLFLSSNTPAEAKIRMNGPRCMDMREFSRNGPFPHAPMG